MQGKLDKGFPHLYTITPIPVKAVKIHGLKGQCMYWQLNAANPESLSEEDIQKRDAGKIYDWLILNLPHGTFTKLREMITTHDLRLKTENHPGKRRKSE